MAPVADDEPPGDHETGADPAVHVHVHFVMTGAFPLRLVDLCFTDDAVVAPEYALLTPLFGLARGQAPDEAAHAVERYRDGGLAALEALANRVQREPYSDVEAVVLFDGGPVARPKLSIRLTEGPPLAYRLHAPVDLDELTAALRSLGKRRDFTVERRSGIGIRPLTNVRRFLADR
ncbi:hypothetical protein VB773_14510 [Haloarculaceae archaeon H-GB2-1]|nr:hypothetical protein [Haloarculaceae archaeon H-GB1-1]MEA5387170.1 hypothetical protein [Haloarculaceae archaeon H-GB11]MEA5408662.1 hypothetical protein [Haloarculaceae archaeon H-GB2-1]